MTKARNMLPLNIQFFAESASTGGSDAQSTATGSTADASSAKVTTESNYTPNGQSSSNEANKASESNSTLEKLIQSAVDRATNKLGNENKTLRAQLDDIMKQKLTDDERIELERKQEREQFEQEKAQFIAEKNRLHAVTALAKADLGVGSDKLETLVSLVIGKDEKEINENVKNLSNIVKELVAGKVDQKFKDNGRVPAGSGVKDAKGKNEASSIASKLGKSVKEANEKSADILKYYTGG